MRREKGNLIGWFFLAPSMILYLWFFIYPMIEAFRLSFFKWAGFKFEKEFIGIKNYIMLFKDDDFYFVIKNTFLILVVGGIIIFLLAFCFSVMLGSGIKGKRFFRNSIFLPYVIAPVAHAIFWGIFVFSPINGLINNFFRLIHFEAGANFIFLSSKNVLWSVLFVVIWVWIGFFIIILMSAMERIPPYLYEAARLEGANEFQLFFKVTIPLVKEVVLIMITFWFITAMKMFDILYAFGSGAGSGISSRRELWVNAIYIYSKAFGDSQNPVFRLGYACSIGVVTLIIVIIGSIIIRRLIKREIYEY